MLSLHHNCRNENVIVVIAVAFLGQVIDWKGGSDIAYFGGAVALVTAALTYFITAKAGKDKKSRRGEHPGQDGPPSA